MGNYFNLRKRQEGLNGSSRTVIGTNYNLAEKLGAGILGYDWGEVAEAILGMLDHVPKVIIKSKLDALDKIMGYEPVSSFELLYLRDALRAKRPDIQFE